MFQIKRQADGSYLMGMYPAGRPMDRVRLEGTRSQMLEVLTRLKFHEDWLVAVFGGLEDAEQADTFELRYIAADEYLLIDPTYGVALNDTWAAVVVYLVEHGINGDEALALVDDARYADAPQGRVAA